LVDQAKVAEQPPARGREEVTGTTEPPIADRTVFDDMPEEAEAAKAEADELSDLIDAVGC